jgi:hypothetical protein
VINTSVVSEDRLAMAAAVSRYNIKHFCKRLVEETDETKLQTILDLIAEERTKLNALMDPANAKPLRRMVTE